MPRCWRCGGWRRASPRRRRLDPRHRDPRRRRLVGVAAPGGGHAAPALRRARLAHVAPVQDQPVVRGPQQLARHPRRPGRPPPRARCAPGATPVRLPRRKMCVSTAMASSPEGHVEHHGGGLAPHARQRLQRLALARHLAAVGAPPGSGTGRRGCAPCPATARSSARTGRCPRPPAPPWPRAWARRRTARAWRGSPRRRWPARTAPRRTSRVERGLEAELALRVRVGAGERLDERAHVRRRHARRADGLGHGRGLRPAHGLGAGRRGGTWWPPISAVPPAAARRRAVGTAAVAGGRARLAAGHLGAWLAWSPSVAGPGQTGGWWSGRTARALPWTRRAAGPLNRHSVWFGVSCMGACEPRLGPKARVWPPVPRAGPAGSWWAQQGGRAPRQAPARPLLLPARLSPHSAPSGPLPVRPTPREAACSSRPKARPTPRP